MNGRSRRHDLIVRDLHITHHHRILGNVDKRHAIPVIIGERKISIVLKALENALGGWRKERLEVQLSKDETRGVLGLRQLLHLEAIQADTCHQASLSIWKGSSFGEARSQTRPLILPGVSLLYGTSMS